MEFTKILLSSLISVAALFASTKLMGKRQVGQLSLFDYLCGITIGSIAAELATDLESFWKPLVALAVFTLFQILAAFLTEKSLSLRKFIAGKPEPLYSDGCLYKGAFKRARIDIDELLSEMRVAGYSSLADIRAALLEPNGRISFIPVAAKRPSTNSDMGLTPEEDCYATPVITDGKILKLNLKSIGKDERWLKQNLKKQGFGEPSAVFYASCDGDSLTVFKVKE